MTMDGDIVFGRSLHRFRNKAHGDPRDHHNDEPHVDRTDRRSCGQYNWGEFSIRPRVIGALRDARAAPSGRVATGGADNERIMKRACLETCSPSIPACARAPYLTDSGARIGCACTAVRRPRASNTPSADGGTFPRRGASDSAKANCGRPPDREAVGVAPNNLTNVHRFSLRGDPL
jgi:hypothetical protein